MVLGCIEVRMKSFYESFSNLIGLRDWIALDVVFGGTVEGDANTSEDSVISDIALITLTLLDEESWVINVK